MTFTVAGLTIGDIMSHKVVTVGPETTLRNLVEVLVGRGISGAPVVAGDRVVGVVSATDLLEFEFSNSGVPVEPADQADWGADPPVPEWQEAQGEYFRRMWENVGTDVVERFESVQGPEWDVLEEHTVSEVMTRVVFALPPDTSVAEAARYMQRNRIHRVLVMTDDKLLGVVTTSDVVRAVGEERI